MKTYMKRYIMAALLLAAGIGGAQATDYYVGTNQTEGGNRYKTLEKLFSSSTTNWQSSNTVHITSDLSVTKQISIDHNCTIMPDGGSWTISVDETEFSNRFRTVLITDKGATVTLEGNGSYVITIKGFGWNIVPEGDDRIGWINDEKFARCVTVNPGTTFNFKAGTLTHGYGKDGGGGIRVESKGIAVMSDNAIITECSSKQGGGVYNNGTFTLEGKAQITNNSAWVDNRLKLKKNEGKSYEDPTFENLDVALGGGICNEREKEGDDAKLYIKGGTISNNKISDPLKMRANEYDGDMEDGFGHAYPSLAPAGAGVSIYGGTAEMSGGIITNNIVDLPESGNKDDSHTNGGGGVQVTSVRNKTEKDNDYADWMKGSFTMSAGTISKNGARRGGGLILGGQSETTITGGTIITENWALQQGGGIFLNKQYALFNADNVQFIMNECKNGGGGAIYVNESDPRTIVKKSTFKDNKCKYSGGAIILEHSGSTDNAYMHLQDIIFDGNYSDKIKEDDAKNNSSNNGNAISNKGKLYISGTFTLKNTNGYNQDWGLRSCVKDDKKYHEHVIFKEGAVTFKGSDGKPIPLGIHIIDPSDRTNIFVSTVKSDVTEGDRQLFKVKTTDWVGTEYFNSREVAAGLGDIDKDYNADQMYSGWNESRNSTRKVAPKEQPTPVIELHRLGQITITNEALSHGESAVYSVKPKEGALGNALRSAYKVVLTGTDDKEPASVSRTIIDVEPGDYIVTEDTWNWAYDNETKQSGPTWVAAGEEKSFTFGGNRQSPKDKKILYDEDIKVNDFATKK